jgi:hypothetical protein
VIDWHRRMFEISKHELEDRGGAVNTVAQTLHHAWLTFQAQVPPASLVGDNLVLMWGDDFHRLCRGYTEHADRRGRALTEVGTAVARPRDPKELLMEVFAVLTAANACTHKTTCPICAHRLRALATLAGEAL